VEEQFDEHLQPETAGETEPIDWHALADFCQAEKSRPTSRSLRYRTEYLEADQHDVDVAVKLRKDRVGLMTKPKFKIAVAPTLKSSFALEKMNTSLFVLQNAMMMADTSMVEGEATFNNSLLETSKFETSKLDMSKLFGEAAPAFNQLAASGIPPD